MVYVGRWVKSHRGLEALPARPQSRPQVLLEPPVASSRSCQDDRIDLVDAELSGLFLLVAGPVVSAVAVPGALHSRLIPLARFLELQREFVPHRHEDFGYQGQPLELGHSGGDVPRPGLPAAGFRVLQVQSPPGCRLFPCPRRSCWTLLTSLRLFGAPVGFFPGSGPQWRRPLRGRSRDSRRDGFHLPFGLMPGNNCPGFPCR